jgi:hypothetical protein
MIADNLATRYIRRSAAAVLDRNWAAVADCMAEDFHMEDHRSGLRSTLDKAETVAMTRVMGDLGVDAIDVEVLETRDDYVALCRITNHVDEFTVCTLSIAKAGNDERALALIVFDEDALDRALAQLDLLAEEAN